MLSRVNSTRLLLAWHPVVPLLRGPATGSPGLSRGPWDARPSGTSADPRPAWYTAESRARDGGGNFTRHPDGTVLGVPEGSLFEPAKVAARLVADHTSSVDKASVRSAQVQDFVTAKPSDDSAVLAEYGVHDVFLLKLFGATALYSARIAYMRGLSSYPRCSPPYRGTSREHTQLHAAAIPF